MSKSPRLTLSATTIGAPDARSLSEFYRCLLGWDVVEDGPDWVTLRPPGGGSGLSFQTEAGCAAPAWPAAEGQQHMMMHLDLRVEDICRPLGGTRKRAGQPWPRTSRRRTSGCTS